MVWHHKHQNTMVAKAAESGSPNMSGWIRINCPICEYANRSPDRKKSLGVNSTTGGYRCWRCDASGCSSGRKVIELVKKDEKKQVMDFSSSFKEFLPLYLPEAYENPFLLHQINYLNGRGISHDHILNARIHGCIEGKLNGRIVTPHFGPDKKVDGFSARLARKAGPGDIKVLYPESMDRELLYNRFHTADETDHVLYVMEGALDVVKTEVDCGIDAVACLGLPTEPHFGTLLNCKRPIVFCLDGDAYEKSRALYQRMWVRGYKYGCGWIKIPSGRDPGDCPTGTLVKLMDSVKIDF